MDIGREAAKQMFRDDRNSDGCFRLVMTKLDKIYDSFEKELEQVKNLNIPFVVKSKNTGKSIVIVGGEDTHMHEELTRILAEKLHDGLELPEIVKLNNEEVKQKLEIMKMPLTEIGFTPPPTRRDRRKSKNKHK